MLFAWKGLSCVAAWIEGCLQMSGLVLQEDGVTPSGGVAVRDYVAGRASPLSFPERTAQGF